MDELQKQILVEKENVEIALDNLRLTKSKDEKTVIELAAIGTFLHNIFNGIENIPEVWSRFLEEIEDF